MNVDEAMAIADSSNFAAEWYDGSLSEAVGVLRKEVERLRAELELSKANVQSLKKALFEVQEAAIRLGDQVGDAKAELAEAKGASVCPVKFYWCYQTNECDILIHGMNDEDSTRFGNWLDDRIKERGER